MRKSIILVIIVLLSVAVLAYYDGQTIPQSAIDNFDTNISFSETFTAFECEVFENAERKLTTSGKVYYSYKVGCWNIRLEDDTYTLRWKNITRRYFLYTYKEGLIESCGYPANSTCKSEFTLGEIRIIRQSFIRRILGILTRIDGWKTEAEPDMSMDFD